MNAVYGLYASPDSVQRVVDGLRATGVAERDITVISSEPLEAFEFSRRDEATWLHWIAGGGGVGGLAFAAWLTSMTEKAWPIQTGNMPIVAWWPNIIVMFELTMLGGMLATVVALFITALIPARGPMMYDSEVTDGKILVGVEHPPEAAIPAIERALLLGEGASLKRV